MVKLIYGVGTHSLIFSNIVSFESTSGNLDTGYQEILPSLPYRYDRYGHFSSPQTPLTLTIKWMETFINSTEYEDRINTYNSFLSLGPMPLNWYTPTYRKWVYSRVITFKYSRDSKGTEPFLAEFTMTLLSANNFWYSRPINYTGFLGDTDLLLSSSGILLWDLSNYSLITGPTTIIIPHTGDTIGYLNLALITLPNSLTGIGPFLGAQTITLELRNSQGYITWRGKTSITMDKVYHIDGLLGKYTKKVLYNDYISNFSDWELLSGTGLLPVQPGSNTLEISGTINSLYLAYSLLDTWR